MRRKTLIVKQTSRVIGVFVLLLSLLAALAQEAASYLSGQASNPEITDGVARLLHYLPEDMPISVSIPELTGGLQTTSGLETTSELETTNEPERTSEPETTREPRATNSSQTTNSQKREVVIRAFKAWQEALPELVQFEFPEQPPEDALFITWQKLEEGKIGSYQYTYSVQADGQYRFRATDIFLDPSLDDETLYRYALVQVGHALGLLGRSPYSGDAMSQSPSGVISEKDKATLQALYAVPSGTPLF
jgi:hypothetical protein